MDSISKENGIVITVISLSMHVAVEIDTREPITRAMAVENRRTGRSSGEGIGGRGESK